jgi:WD40 repeat protein
MTNATRTRWRWLHAALWLTAAVAQQPAEPPQRLEHTARVTALAAIDDGRVLVGGGSDGSLVFWTREAGRPVRAAVVASAHAQPATAVAASADGQRVASGCRGGVLRVWNAATRELLWEARRQEERHSNTIEDARFHADGTLLTAGHDGAVRWWNTATGAELRHVRHDAQVYSLALGKDGSTLFTGGDDPGLRIWRAADGAPVRFVPAKGNQFFALAAGARSRLVAGGATLVVYAQDDVPASGRQLRDRAHHGWIQSVALSPDETRVASGGSDGAVRVWDAATGEELRTWKDHAGGVAAVLFLDRGNTIAAADDRGVLLHRP